MVDVVTAVSTALTGIKTATELAKIVKEAGNAFEEAEFKLKMAELLTALAESQSALAESTQSLNEKDAEIQRISDLLKLSENLERHMNAYFKVDKNGKLVGDPYCQHCWEANKLAVHLAHVSRSESKCSACGETYHAAYVRLPA